MPFTRYSGIPAQSFDGLTDPGDDRIAFWDDSLGATTWLVVGSNLTITGTTLDASGGGISDGDKGDVTVSASGTVWTIDNDAVTYAKMQNVSATDKLLGRSTSGAGNVEEITCTAFARSILDDADEATFKATVNLEIGTDIQAYDADLSAIAALGGTNTIYYRSGAATWASVTIGSGLDFTTGTLSATGGSGATTALDNLASVAINTSLVSDTDNTDALGSSSKSWSDLFLGSGGIVDFASGDVQITHSSGVATVSAGDLRVATAGTNAASVVAVGGTQTLTNKTLTTPVISGAITFPDNVRQTFNPGANAAGLNVGSITGDPDTPSNGDLWYDSAANELTARINGATVALGAIGSAATPALDNLASVAINTSLISDTDNTDDLGSGTKRWKDIYTQSIGTGASSGSFAIRARDVDGASWVTFINLDAGNTPACQLSGVTSSSDFLPTASNTAALGDLSTMWSDLFLASGAVINFNNGNCTFTHSNGVGVEFAGGVFLVPSAGLQVGGSVPFSDAAGTLTLQNVDALDATTEATIEAAIDTLANLTSIQGHTVTLTGAFIRAGAHSLTLTTTGTTGVTLPTTGTLATLAGAESLSNKTVVAPIVSGSAQFTGRNYSDLDTLTDGATITIDWSTGNSFTVTLGGNRTIAFSNDVAGQIIRVRFLQDGTGSRTLTWPGGLKWAGGSAPTLTTTASKADWIGFICTSAGSAYDAVVLSANH